MRNRFGLLVVALAAAGCFPAESAAQDGNILFPADSLERWLRYVPFEIADMRDARFEGDRTQRVLLSFPNRGPILVKWAQAPGNGREFNNQPRYEIAAYELQKLFLDESEYVVPPTVARVVPLERYREYEPGVDETFDNTASAVVVLQYWLFNVTAEGVYDEDRLRTDPAYLASLGNLNILTYLIDHKDANFGNILISRDSAQPRLFSVDNGVAFGSLRSDRGDDWRRLRVERLPGATVARLRKIEREDLERALGVVAEFEKRDGRLVQVEPTANLDAGRGVRETDDVVQLGLSSREIGRVYARLTDLLEEVDEGDVATFDPSIPDRPGIETPGPIHGEYGLWVRMLEGRIEVNWITRRIRPGFLSVYVDGRMLHEVETRVAQRHRASFEAPRARQLRLRYGGLEDPSDLHETTLYLDPERGPPIYAGVDSLFTVGDVHGEYDRLVQLLRNAGLVDTDLRWTGGTKHLALLGDIVDRGPDVTRTLWFLYDLERQAERQGGRVHVLLGNHEIMVLTGDLRYVSPKEELLAQLYGTSYSRLFDPRQSILGQWLATKPALMRINDIILAHGGVTPEYAAYGIEAYDDSLAAYMGEELFPHLLDPGFVVAIDSAALARRIDFFFSEESVFWYRGYVRADTLDADLTYALEALDGSLQVIAHTPVRSIQQRYGGAVIPTQPLEPAAEMLLLVHSSEGYRRYRYPLVGPPEPLPPAPPRGVIAPDDAPVDTLRVK